jgi:polysaccharide biosynthesis transport protein
MATMAPARNVPKPQRQSEAALGGLEYYGFQDYKQLLLRRKWFIVSITFGIALITAVVVYFMPNAYKADTVVLVDPGKVPETYVKSTASVSANERLALLQEQILSNTRLSQVIDQMGLFANLKKTHTLEEILLLMREHIEIKPVTFTNSSHGLEAFTVSYTSQSAPTAARVANQLASSFIEENLRSREQQVMGTTEFFDRELEKAKEELDEKGRKLASLRAHYSAELPESQNAHLQGLASLQLEMRGEMDAVNRAQQQKVYLQSVLANSPTVVDLDSNGSTTESSGLEEQLARLQTDLDQLRSRYGPQYPDVLKRTKEIEDLQGQIKKEDKSTPANVAPAPAVKRQNPVIESQIAALDQEVQKHEEREKDLKSQIEYHQSALERAPGVEQQLAAITRDYQNAEDEYKNLQDRKFSADMSSDVETRQKAERFVILEPAQPPFRPYQPNRPLIDGLGLAGGLLVALALVLALELLDETMKTEREVGERFQVPIFGEIPWFMTKAAKRRRTIRAAFAVCGNTVLALGYAVLVAIALR